MTRVKGRLRIRFDDGSFLSARDDDAAKLRGLGLGADDYIVKSSSPAEVAARIRAALRRCQRGERRPSTILPFGRLSIDPVAHEASVDGEPVAFPAKEFELLCLFAELPRQVFTREQIVERPWEGWADPQAVNGPVNRVRGKIEPDPSNPTFITTVSGVGCRFIGGPNVSPQCARSQQVHLLIGFFARVVDQDRVKRHLAPGVPAVSWTLKKCVWMKSPSFDSDDQYDEGRKRKNCGCR